MSLDADGNLPSCNPEDRIGTSSLAEGQTDEAAIRPTVTELRDENGRYQDPPEGWMLVRGLSLCDSFSFPGVIRRLHALEVPLVKALCSGKAALYLAPSDFAELERLQVIPQAADTMVSVGWVKRQLQFGGSGIVEEMIASLGLVTEKCRGANGPPGTHIAKADFYLLRAYAAVKYPAVNPETDATVQAVATVLGKQQQTIRKIIGVRALDSYVRYTDQRKRIVCVGAEALASLGEQYGTDLVGELLHKPEYPTVDRLMHRYGRILKYSVSELIEGSEAILTNIERAELLTLVQAGNKMAAPINAEEPEALKLASLAEKILMQAHWYLIRRTVHKYDRVLRDDLIQEGTFGLRNAIRRTDIANRQKSFNFQGFAVTAINNRMLDSLKADVSRKKYVVVDGPVSHDESAVIHLGGETIDPESHVVNAENNLRTRRIIDTIARFVGQQIGNDEINRGLVAKYLFQEDQPPLKDIASDLGISLPAAKSRIHRIRTAIKKHLADELNVDLAEVD